MRSQTPWFAAVFILILALLLGPGCAEKTSPTPTLTPEQSSISGEKEAGVIRARIIQVTEGPLMNGYPTTLITIDKGSQDGVLKILKGWVPVQGVMLLEEVVIEVAATTSILQGPYYEGLSVGQLVLVTGPGISQDKVFELANEQKTAISPEDTATNTVLSEYYPRYMDSDVPGLQAIVSQYKSLIPTVIADLLDFANTWAQDMWTGVGVATWSQGDNIDFPILVDLGISMYGVYDQVVGGKAIPDLMNRVAQIAISARDVALIHEESVHYYEALQKLKNAALVSDLLVFDGGKNPLEAQIFEDCARIYSKMGMEDRANEIREAAAQLK